MDAERLRWIAVVIGLVIGGLLVVGGFIAGADWIQFAGGVLGVGSGAVAAKRAP